VTRRRVNRVAKALKQEISDLLQNEVKDPRVGFASVVGVEMSSDLRHAKIYVSVYGDDADKKQTFQALRDAAGFIRSGLGSRLNLRHIPEIAFVPDESIAHGARIMELLDIIKKEDGAEDNSEG